jgi:hypothetical protein
MGSMGCNRIGCESVLCDRYSADHGYICDECFDELVANGLTVDIEDFMNSLKMKGLNNDAVRKYFEVIFGDM